jgi:hypothetical protein
MKIRIIAPGIHGLEPTAENPTGEYPIGAEFTTDAKLPEGWKGKYHVVSHDAAEGSTAVTNPAQTEGANPLDGTLPELTKHIEAITDPDAIEKLIADEKAGKNRSGAISTLEARRDELLEA